MRVKLSLLARSPLFFGVVAGTVAVAVQLLLMPGRNAYGLCTVCHTRDALAWLAGKRSDATFMREFARSGWPAFTPAGMLPGSLAASVRHREFRRVAASSRVRMLCLGCLVALAGLAVMSCPTRLFLRLAYADTFAPLTLIGLFVGIVVATAVIRRV